MRFIDAHTHLSDVAFIEDLSAVRERYLSAGVIAAVDSGCDGATSKSALNLSEKFPEVYFTAGVHPENAANGGDIDEIIPLLVNKKCLAVGEAGFDKHYEGYDYEVQKACFLKQICLADKFKLPLVIHSRDAAADTLSVLKENVDKLNCGFLMHCYSYSLELVDEFKRMGGYFSFGGVITFKNAKKAEIIKRVGIDRILFETDAPYLSPEPLRGRRNEQANVKFVYEYAAGVLGVTVCELADCVEENFKRLFTKYSAK